jgi:hypothetical protein
MANPSDKYRQNAVLEGGSSGSAGSGMASKAPYVAATLSGLAASSMPFIAATRAEEAMKERREAIDELKREKRGVEKTPSDRAREDAREMRMMELNDKASRAASRDMGMKKGGKVSSASSRADGIAQRGKTRGKMVMCGGGKV